MKTAQAIDLIGLDPKDLDAWQTHLIRETIRVCEIEAARQRIQLLHEMKRKLRTG